MESNLLLEQYSWYKKQQLAKAPFECLLNADIEPNPHQVNAFCAAIQALKTGGIILADEVGLGKTIEAGLVLNYVLDNGAKKVLISLPATLRKQWEVELLEKFGRQAVILDRYTVEHDLANVQTHLGNADEVSIVIASYDYSSKLIKRFPHVKWDFLIIDEAHNLRNVFHGTKRAKNLYDLTHGIPKILLTATPLQNSLTDLHGLVSFIDPRIFGSEKVFNRRFVDGCDYEELKQELLPVLYRTLRRDVGKYMAFSKRTCITVDFHLSTEEKELYDVTNDFLRRDPLYSIPNANRGLIILVIRKLLASSSFALIETFEVLEKRLEKLYEGTKSAYAQEGFDLFWGFVEDEIDEDGFNEYDDEETAEKKQAIQAELKIVRHVSTYKRHPQKETVVIDLQEFSKNKEYPLVCDSNVILYVSKIGLKQGYTLITAYVNNKRKNPESDIAGMMFQVNLRAYSQDKMDIFVAEHICRKILAVDEFYFAQRPILGRGRGCAATWKANKNGRASEIVSTFIPEYEFPGVSAALEGFDPFFFSMRTLSVAKKKDDIINRLNVLANSYEDWIQKKLIHDSKMDDAKFKKEIGDTVINKCIEALGRIRAGIQLLVEDDTAFDAFCFMNRSMILQRNIMNFSKKHGAGIECAFRDFVDPRDPSNNFGWRPFQIAFILMNLKGIVDPEHDNREVVDLLYFPTGGGKTEAYLGLMAFVIANRRLRAEENDEYNRDGGVTAILRYTLRLLTTQ